MIKKKILAHALNWPAAILLQEENRLMQRLAANPEKASQPQPPEIAVLQEGRQQITQLTQRCLNENIRPAEYTQQVQAVLNRVEQKGGVHNNFLTVVARVAANHRDFFICRAPAFVLQKTDSGNARRSRHGIEPVFFQR